VGERDGWLRGGGIGAQIVGGGLGAIHNKWGSIRIMFDGDQGGGNEES